MEISIGTKGVKVNRWSKKIVPALLLLVLVLFVYLISDEQNALIGSSNENDAQITTEIITEITSEVTVTETNESESITEVETEAELDEFAAYYSATDVGEYIHTYNQLPSNYLTKNEAMDLGWDSDKGNLWDVTDKMVIGGDVFGNREGLLPDKQGRIWYECDVNYTGGFRNAHRIVFSNDGLVYYTSNHYESFKKLYD